MTAHIVFTGGGSAGHVTPNLALIERCQQAGIPVAYIGSTDGIERDIVAPTGIPYHAIATGKLRRYLSWRHLVDPFKIAWGITQAFFKLGRLRPAVIFAKGGFVSFPVAVAARLRGIALIVHESDMTPGLANRLCFPLAQVICVNDAKVKPLIKPQHKVMVTGTPLREQLLRGDRTRGWTHCQFTEEKPTVLIMGGGLGADKINHTVRASLDRLLARFNVIHLCGKGKTDDLLTTVPGYRQFAYVSEELPDLLALADLVISRAGANAVYELLCLRKPHILIPLVRGSRGDQVHNARHFAKQGVSRVLNEVDLTPDSLMTEIERVYADKDALIQKLTDLKMTPGNQIIFDLLQARVTSRDTYL